jgi:hypothetical protein
LFWVITAGLAAGENPLAIILDQKWLLVLSSMAVAGRDKAIQCKLLQPEARFTAESTWLRVFGTRAFINR